MLQHRPSLRSPLSRGLLLAFFLLVPLQLQGCKGIDTLASLTPKYKLQRYDDCPLQVPYKQISVSPGSHRLYLDLRLFDPSGKLVAATLNKDFTLEIPEPPSSAPSSR